MKNAEWEHNNKICNGCDVIFLYFYCLINTLRSFDELDTRFFSLILQIFVDGMNYFAQFH